MKIRKLSLADKDLVKCHTHLRKCLAYQTRHASYQLPPSITLTAWIHLLKPGEDLLSTCRRYR
jgi:hypothetical protein